MLGNILDPEGAKSMKKADAVTFWSHSPPLCGWLHCADAPANGHPSRRTSFGISPCLFSMFLAHSHFRREA